MAADDEQLGRTIARYGRVDLSEIDELGYLELDRRGADVDRLTFNAGLIETGTESHRLADTRARNLNEAK